MKSCPACGYQDTPSARTMIRRYKAAFGDFPIVAMMKRGWLLGCGFSDERGWPTVDEVRDALKRFFGADYGDVMAERVGSPNKP